MRTFESDTFILIIRLLGPQIGFIMACWYVTLDQIQVTTFSIISQLCIVAVGQFYSSCMLMLREATPRDEIHLSVFH